MVQRMQLFHTHTHGDECIPLCRAGSALTSSQPDCTPLHMPSRTSGALPPRFGRLAAARRPPACAKSTCSSPRVSANECGRLRLCSW